MAYDYSDAPPPQFEVIPHGTTATLVLHIRAGDVGEDGLLTRSKDGGCEMLAIVLTVIDGPFKGRKLWQYLILQGTTPGHAQAADISRGVLKAILDTTRGLKPDDMSDAARAARTVELKDFENATFLAKIGVEKGGPKNDGSGENWPDKNILVGVITPDKRDWHPVEQPPPFNGGGGGAQAAPAETAAPIARPGWAS